MSAVFRSRRYAFPNKDEEMTETMLAQHTVDTIANLSSSKLPQPFFLAVGFVRLHGPLSLSLSPTLPPAPVPPFYSCFVAAAVCSASLVRHVICTKIENERAAAVLSAAAEYCSTSLTCRGTRRRTTGTSIRTTLSACHRTRTSQSAPQTSPCSQCVLAKIPLNCYALIEEMTADFPRQAKDSK